MSSSKDVGRYGPEEIENEDDAFASGVESTEHFQDLARRIGASASNVQAQAAPAGFNDGAATMAAFIWRLGMQIREEAENPEEALDAFFLGLRDTKGLADDRRFAVAAKQTSDLPGKAAQAALKATRTNA